MNSNKEIVPWVCEVCERKFEIFNGGICIEPLLQTRFHRRRAATLYVGKLMCKCAGLPKFFKSDSSDPDFKKFKRIDWKDDAWVKLIECPECGQWWQLDEWDKYQTGLAIKIEDHINWQSFNDKMIRIEYLIQNRGGLSDEVCSWQGCNNKALKGLAYCPSCAYGKSGIRY